MKDFNSLMKLARRLAKKGYSSADDDKAKVSDQDCCFGQYIPAAFCDDFAGGAV